MTRIRSKLTYANVMATIAVFAVLGGGAYAASKVGPNDIKKNAVRSKHIKKKAVKGKHLDNTTKKSLRGPRATTVTRDNPIGQVNQGSGRRTVLTLPGLPRGSYVLHAKTVGNANVGGDTAFFSCQLRVAGDTVDETQGETRSPIGLVTQASVTTTAPSDVTLECLANNPPNNTGTWDAQHAKITAIQVGSQTTSPVSG